MIFLVWGASFTHFAQDHQSVYKDRNGVYASGYPIENADPKSFRKVVDLDEHFTALLADDRQYYVFLPYRGEVYSVAIAGDSLNVRRQIWAAGTPQHRVDGVGPVAISTAELRAKGWQNQTVMLDEGTEANQITKDQEAHLLNLYTAQFVKAWHILRQGPDQEPLQQPVVNRESLDERPAQRNVTSKEWKSNIVAFEKYLEELAAAGRVPEKPELVKRVTIVPGGSELDSEVLPVTDGAGGFIDTRPANDTVQYRVNEALKGKKVAWEFELQRDAVESHTGVVRLVPKITGDDAVPFLSSIWVKPSEGQTSSFDYRAGETLNVEGTIGDFARNDGTTPLELPFGPVAVYHLDSAPHTVFWIGLTDVTITSQNHKMTTRNVEPSVDVSAIAKSLLRASFRYDEQKLKTIYAPEVRLLPGNRLFQYGLELPTKMTSFGVLVELDKMLPALKKQADKDPVPEPMVAAIVSLFRIEQIEVSAGEFVANPNQQGESVFDQLRFTIQENDVLLKVSVPGAFRYLQLRKLDNQWKVLAEY